MTVGLALALSGVAQANVWMDENFEGATVFVQGNGTPGGVPGATLDTYDSDGAVVAGKEVSTKLTTTGTVDSSKFYFGAKCYKLTTGQTLACTNGYDNPTNGNFQIFQFGVNVDPIPVAAGTVGTFRWNFDTDTGTPPDVDYSYYVKFVADGAGNVNIIAGEDVHNTPTPTETNIGQLTSASQWTYLSLVMQKDPAAKTDSRLSGKTPASFTQAMHFFNASDTEATSIAFGGLGTGFNSKDWAFTVETGNTLYIDTIYWDGGLDDDAANSNVHPFTLPPASVTDWTLF